MEYITLLKEWLTLEHLLEVLQEYKSFGPIPGFLLVILEAFLPFLPLIVIVLTNAAAFGLWYGFLISWSGSVVGATIVFLLIRRLQNKSWMQKFLKRENVQKTMSWVERHGFAPIFLLFCFPFSPSFLINAVAALSKMKFHSFLLALTAGKMVMIFSISYVGYDIVSFISKPTKTIIVICVMLLLWYIGKRIENRLQTVENN
ncbi:MULTISPECIES: TVP38/TMEM64 family protein [Bacillus]|uniref:TVP38/TMEM64 family protein n=1 Tax=Bacillus TaxID=1386 RepID=UPI000BB73D9D|nr:MULTISPECIES: TVP38/TMEM64 family protein [Bacillus]